MALFNHGVSIMLVPAWAIIEATVTNAPALKAWPMVVGRFPMFSKATPPRTTLPSVTNAPRNAAWNSFKGAAAFTALKDFPEVWK